MIGIAVRAIPKRRQFLAFLESSYLIANHEIKPPAIPPKIGRRYQKLLRIRVEGLLKEDIGTLYCSWQLKKIVILDYKQNQYYNSFLDPHGNEVFYPF